MESNSLLGTRLGKYELQAEIGRGGMGAVYRAHDPALDRLVAVKVLAPHLVWEREFVERFLREARAAARLNHPNIVTIYDVGQEGSWYYFVMEYLEGQPLTALLARHPPMAPQDALEILTLLADALDYAHGQGLVHRDVKPANVMVSSEGRVTLTDFGIAHAAQATRLTRSGAVMGTPEYMSPEQALGRAVDSRTDQYSLAVVAYEMLAGRASFHADSTPALLHRIAYEAPLPLHEARPDIPAGLATGLARALVKDPGQRYHSCRELITAFEEAATLATVHEALGVGEGLAVGGPGAPGGERATEHRRIPVWAWAIVGLLIGAGILLFAWRGAVTLPAVRPDSSPTSVPVPTRTMAQAATATSVQTPSRVAEPTDSPRPASTAKDTPSPIPTLVPPTATAIPPTDTPQLTLAYRPIPLGSFANASFTANFQAPPTGEVTLGGIPFQLSANIFKSQASAAPDSGYPTGVRLPVDVPHAARLHILLTSGNGLNEYAGQVVGRVVAYCDGPGIVIAELQLGRDVREWHGQPNVVSRAPRAREVWSGPLADFPDLTGHIDLLTLDLPSECQQARLSSFELVDTSSETVGSLDPAFNFTGLTIEYYR